MKNMASMKALDNILIIHTWAVPLWNMGYHFGIEKVILKKGIGIKHGLI